MKMINSLGAHPHCFPIGGVPAVSSYVKGKQKNVKRGDIHLVWSLPKLLLPWRRLFFKAGRIG